MINDLDINSMYAYCLADVKYTSKYFEKIKPVRILNRKYWPVSIKINDEDYEKATRWCYENFKSANWRNINPSYFYFKREQDATLFSLRWA